ncbi:acyl-CoA dehydrogenase family protein [Myxococcaceae bacterium GXIMD 01537]
MDAILRFLLTTPPESAPVDSVEAWWRGHQALAPRFTVTADLALAGGFLADRLGYAFASGYHAALRSLFPALAADTPAALCATEAGGNHPSHIQTRLTARGDGSFQLDGAKAFVTFGTLARQLLVVASEGQDAQGRNRLRFVRIDPARPGVTVTALPQTPFVPEVPHAELTLEGVAVAAHEVLPGDGYARYLKPFRTVEDCHVHAAFLGWLMQVARRSGWPAAVQDEILAVAAAVRSMALSDPESPAVHVALGGVLDLSARLVERAAPLWAQVDAATRERWERDRALLHVAGKARARRREAARERLSQG